MKNKKEIDDKVSGMSHDEIVEHIMQKDSVIKTQKEVIESLRQENESINKRLIVDIERLEKDLTKNKEMCLDAIEKLNQFLR